MEPAAVRRGDPPRLGGPSLAAAAVPPTRDGRSPPARSGRVPTWCGTSARCTPSGRDRRASGCEAPERVRRPGAAGSRTTSCSRSPSRPAADRLAGVLSATDPATPVWTWAPQKDVGVRGPADGPGDGRPPRRRRTGGRPRPPHRPGAGLRRRRRVPRVPARVAGDTPALAGSVHLHCTDVDGEWLVTAGRRRRARW